MRIFLKKAQGCNNAQTITCSEGTCDRATKHGKTYCSDHIGLMAYAKGVTIELTRRDTETQALATNKRLPRNSHLVKEAFALLWEYQSISAPGLTRHIPISHSEAEVLLKSLADHGLATISQTPRGVEATCTYSGHALPNPTEAADA